MIKKMLLVLLFANICFGLVSNQTDRVSFVGDGSSTVFNYSYPTNATSDLLVKLVLISDGNEVATLLETTHYTATAGESGGAVTTSSFPSSITHPLTSTYEIHIRRVTPKTQTLDLKVGGAVNLEKLEDAYDKAIKLAVEAYQNSLRSIRLPSSSDEVGELSPISDYTSKFLFINAQNQVVGAAGTGDATPHSTWGASWAGITDSSAGLTELYTVDHVLVSDHGNDVDVAIDAMDGNSVLIIDSVDGAAVLSASKALTATQKLVNLPGCYIAGTGSPTLTINGAIQADGKIFDSTITVNGTPLIKELNAKWWGATGDGVTDDTAAIQAAADTAAGASGIVFLPKGVYITSSTITIGTDSHIKGIGAGTVIKCSAAVPAITLTRTWNSVRHLSLQTTNAAGGGIKIERGAAGDLLHVDVEDVHIQPTSGSSTGIAFHIYAGDTEFLSDIVLKDSYIANHKFGIKQEEHASATGVTLCFFNNVWMVDALSQAGGIGFEQGDGNFNGTHFIGGAIESYETAYKHNNDAAGAIIETYFENNTNKWVLGTKFVGSITHTNGGGGVDGNIDRNGDGTNDYYQYQNIEGSGTVTETFFSQRHVISGQQNTLWGCYKGGSIIDDSTNDNFNNIGLAFHTSGSAFPAPSTNFINLLGGHKIAYNTVAPSVGGWGLGDIVFSLNVSPGSPLGWVCTTSGTFGTATDSTGDTDGSTATITGMTDTSDFRAGHYVDVSAGFPTTGPYLVIRKSSTTLTLNVNSNSVQSNITVDTSDPTIVPFGMAESANAYTTSNVTTDRTLDADADTLAQVADVLGTLIEDLKTGGILKAP